MVDAHQDVLARMICGQGMPNFYAKQIAGKAQCKATLRDKLLGPVYNKFGVCKNFRDDYKYEIDDNGNPKVEECLKQPFVLYYASAESLILFESLYENLYGL